MKGEARSDRQSSWSRAAWRSLNGSRSKGLRYARLAFVAFVLLHLGMQAYRARTDGLLPEPGLEARPVVVVGLLLFVWLPVCAFGRLELVDSLARIRLLRPAQERALATIEPAAFAVVLLFAAVHGAQYAWPLLVGNMADVDAREDLVASLSTAHNGIPVHAVIYLCAVGAASFYAVRQSFKALPGASAWLVRAIVSGGVLVCLLGSYAVIHCASGALLP
jgi:hypothetical protein